jgi:hypothetical protein
VTSMLSVPTGTITAANHGGDVAGSGTGSVVLTGTVQHQHLPGHGGQPAYYVPVANASGPVTPDMVTNDGGNTRRWDPARAGTTSECRHRHQ